jgi:hypothetical protein
MYVRSAFSKLALASLLVLGLFMAAPRSAHSIDPAVGNLDLFTQKTPFSGRGPNETSDAFQQQELVILYALVTFNAEPVANKAVAYQVNGPPNALQNITMIAVAMTNANGIAQFTFRMPTAPINMEQIIFGKWHAIATVDVDETVANDSLTFEVGWLVRIKSIATLDNQLSPQTNFSRQSQIVFNLTLENIGLTPKDATITVNAQDSQEHPMISIELDNQSIKPGDSHIQASSRIPENAGIGAANTSASVYTGPPASGGTPYSPSVYTTFNVITEKHDVAITNVVISSSQVQMGENVEITVEAANLGDFSETFNVTVYYDSNIIQVTPVVALLPHSSKTSIVEWNTANVNPGVYRISANATIVKDDTNPDNNNFMDSSVTIVSAAAVSVPYWLLLIIFVGLAIIAGLAFFMLLLISYYRRRRRKAPKGSRYVVLVHPRI